MSSVNYIEGKYNSLAISKFFISRYEVLSMSMRLNPITPLKLQKLLYILEGVNLNLDNEPLIDEDFEAWKFGPVLPTVYHELKVYKDSDLSLSHFESMILNEVPDHDLRTQILVDFVIRKFDNTSAGRLVTITHSKDGPWHPHYYGANPKADYNEIIPKEEIKSYFGKFIK